ncbi:MAG TPA: DNA polymerase I [Micropepsaceae bacterium]|nr:DNA polymerase I [Micropepsaceae bacterium]
MTALEHGFKREVRAGDHIYLVDGSGFVFRAYHALPPLTRKSDGLPTGAVSGFCNMLWKLLEDTKAGDKPTHLAVIFDAGRVSFRNALFGEYKANRTEPPDDLKPQFPLTRDAVRAFGVACIEKQGFEADDLIATYARLGREAGAKVTIVSSDKDLMQLVDDHLVEMFDTMKNKRIGTAEVIERFGVPPAKVVDVQSLIGDSTDNVPGVPGIGVKTAAKLISEYGDLDALLERASEVKQPKCREALIENAEKARLSRRLVTLDVNVPLDTKIAEFAVREPDPADLLPFLKALEFASLLRRAAAKLGVEDPELFTPVARESGAVGEAPPAAKTPAPIPAESKGCPGAVMDRGRILKAFDHAAYEVVTEARVLDRWIAVAQDLGATAISVEADSPDPMRAKIIGIALATAPGAACYVPLGHAADSGLELSGAAPAQLPEAETLKRLKPLLEDDSVSKIGHDLKFAVVLFAQRGIHLKAHEDSMLMSYVLDLGLNGHGLEEGAEKHLNHKPIALADIIGKGRDRISLDKVAIEAAARYAAEKADVIIRLASLLKPRLVAERRMTVYETLERPMIQVLSEMERAGVMIAPPFLAKLSNDFAAGMVRLEEECCKLAGEKFNLGSPKQLGDILFDKFSLPGGRRTKTGAWSTDADILEELAAQGHELPSRVLEWRQLSKLKSTYTDALPAYVNPTTGRVHTSYELAWTTTGRLSSNEPNLQNIPIRTEEGRRIRRAFVAPEGRLLVSADYSQIELRLLAHIADVPALSKAFAEGLDIHAMTASEMFGVPTKGMPAEVRRRAKAINFGIIYGISAFGLANQLGIPRGEADAYIKKYFERFPGIRDYMDETKAFVREKGYVETIFGRRIYIRDVKAQSAAQRAFGERQAINAPIQGSAADIIRRAMVRLAPALAENDLDAQMLLQVHDELVIETKASQANAVCEVARKVMERATLPAIQLKVPLVVEARAGKNWDEAH